MTAMIDVIFLLLTFLVLTARFRTPEQFVSLDKPKLTDEVKTVGLSAGADSIKPLRLEIKPAGQGGCIVSLAGQEQILLTEADAEKGLNSLAGTLKKTLEGSAQAAGPVELYCDKRLQWNWVVKVYDVLFAAGAGDITFVVEQK